MGENIEGTTSGTITGTIVDVETLRKVNADIILSINEVVKIHEEGSKRRAEAQEELARIEDELKQALLEAGNR